MDPHVHDLHIRAGTRAGRERTCGKKVDYRSEESAEKAAARMNAKPTTRNTLEPYPCAFCHGWHVGRAMSLEELESHAAASE